MEVCFNPVSCCLILLPHHVLSLLCVIFFHFFCHLLFLCTVTDFSAAEKARGVKFCVRVGLLSGQVFSPFDEDRLAGSHGGGGISRRPRVDRRMLLVVMDEQAGVESVVHAVVIYGYGGR